MKKQNNLTLLRHYHNIPVLLKKIDNTKTVSLGILVGAGSITEDSSTVGFSHFIEHMIFKGTQKLNYKDINRFFEQKGAYINAFTTKYYTLFYVHSLKEFAVDVLEKLLQIVFESNFDPQEIEKEKKVVLEEMALYEDDPADYTFDSFYKKTYQGSYLGMPILGEKETIENLTQKSLFDYYHQHYHSENIIISVAGHFEEEKIAQCIQSYSFFKKIGQKLFMSKPQSKSPFYNNLYISQKPITNSYITMGIDIPSFQWDNYIDYHLYSLLLGGISSSRLFLKIREELALCYNIETDLSQNPYTGLFLIAGSTQAKNTTCLLESIHQEIMALNSHFFTAEELEIGKNQLKSREIFHQEKVSSLMIKAVEDYFFYQELKMNDLSLQQIEKASLERLHHVHDHITQKIETISVFSLIPNKLKAKISLSFM